MCSTEISRLRKGEIPAYQYPAHMERVLNKRSFSPRAGLLKGACIALAVTLAILALFISVNTGK